MESRISMGNLVLTIRSGETVVVGPVDKPIATIRVYECEYGRARLSFDAPGIDVNREKVAARKLARGQI